MNKIIITFILMFGFMSANAVECRKFTHEQLTLVYKAYAYGKDSGYGLSLSAISIHESMIGQHIIRINPKDGNGQGSYGITHILLSTAMWLTGEKSKWAAKDWLVMDLITNDDFALDLALRKLKMVETDSWMETINRYNGNSPNHAYAKKIAKNVKMLRQCYHLEG